ncbi:Kinase, NEK [Giardia duodenalis]|uniref:non-specific serine/threonine protein kinase n=1 Tax=Giardia intestinalis (strain ATCC 50803 / WB clone C6) TaxID=184922 RepID=A8B2T6_GIAIC|nr:Kinase, NEK [Giardia intestinalis]KAE8303042.1 Kinase, NEK [Giardia intestinalis]|eukprot:XP_001710045.1 Kinase, NEK [Giardia lamblia ATCC 50803]
MDYCADLSFSELTVPSMAALEDVAEVYKESPATLDAGSAIIEFNTRGLPDIVIKKYPVTGLRRFDAAGVHAILMRITKASGPNILEISSLQYYASHATYEITHPYCVGGSLETLLYERRSSTTPFSPLSIWKLFAQVVAGLLQLYGSTGASDDYGEMTYLLHGSLTPSNILFDSHGTVMLSDYGLYYIRPLFGKKNRYPSFLAPELQGPDAEYTEAVDVWCLGCVLYSLCILQPPQFAPRELRRGVSIYSRSCPTDIRLLLLKCLSLNPANRPSVLEIAMLPVVREAYPELNSMLQPHPRLLRRPHEVSFANEATYLDPNARDFEKHKPSVDIQSMKITDRISHQSAEVFHSILAAVAEAEADFDFGSDVETEKPVAAQKGVHSLEKARNDIYTADAGSASTSEETQEPALLPGELARSRTESPRRRRVRRRVRSRGRSLPGLVLSAGFEGAQPPGRRCRGARRK